MDIIYHDLPDPENLCLPGYIDDLSAVLFTDIETTGFSPRTSKLYLIGCAYYENCHWKSVQFFADSYSDEEEVVSEFLSFSKDFEYLVHFNGSTFDIPYLSGKAKEFKLPFDLESIKGIDIYRQVSKLKSFLLLEDCRQKTVESFLGIDREDKYSGGELIEIYGQYAMDHDPTKRELLLLHNFEDVKGMLDITPILSYSGLFSENPEILKISENLASDSEGGKISELLIEFNVPHPVPVPVSYRAHGCYLTVSGSKGLLKIPLFTGELKYFFADYENYYYLPDEDMAIHKSVASFVDKRHRLQAIASNCYTKKEGTFLPQWEELKSPFFKHDYKDKEMYFEVTDEVLTDKEFFSRYVLHTLCHLDRSQ